VEAHISVAKIGKYATSVSGDTVELIERPNGGLSLVLADGQWSGKSAKAISNIVTRKAVSLLAEGVRDGAVARAASDYLYTYRSGKVQATLNILSIDLQSQTLVITRNNPCYLIIVRSGEITLLNQPSSSIGTRIGIRPEIIQMSLEPGLIAVVFTDGLIHAGESKGQPLDIIACVRQLMQIDPPDASHWANYLLEQAIISDQNRPSDDISVAIIAILPRREDDIRRLTASMPL